MDATNHTGPNLTREKMIGLLTAAPLNAPKRSRAAMTRVDSNGFLFAKNSRGEGFFLIWEPGGASSLTRDTYSKVMQEAKEYGLVARFHVYAAFAPYVARNVEFYKIPDEARRDNYQAIN